MIAFKMKFYAQYMKSDDSVVMESVDHKYPGPCLSGQVVLCLMVSMTSPWLASIALSPSSSQRRAEKSHWAI